MLLWGEWTRSSHPAPQHGTHRRQVWWSITPSYSIRLYRKQKWRTTMFFTSFELNPCGGPLDCFLSLPQGKKRQKVKIGKSLLPQKRSMPWPSMRMVKKCKEKISDHACWIQRGQIKSQYPRCRLGRDTPNLSQASRRQALHTHRRRQQVDSLSPTQVRMVALF